MAAFPQECDSLWTRQLDRGWRQRLGLVVVVQVAPRVSVGGYGWVVLCSQLRIVFVCEDAEMQLTGSGPTVFTWSKEWIKHEG